jgi:4,5-DOPA dioxygenase extradiol
VAGRPLEPLIDGYAYGSISMTAYTLEAQCPRESGDSRSAAELPDPSVVPADETNV